MDQDVVGENLVLPSVKDVLKPAVGPSSSHTLGPMRAGLEFRRRLLSRSEHEPDERISVTLYGSLAHTGKGHLTDLAVVAGLCGYGPEHFSDRSMSSLYQEIDATGVLLFPDFALVFLPRSDIVFDKETPPEPHPNTLRFALLDRTGRIRRSDVFCSIGGGLVVDASKLDRVEDAIPERQASARAIIRSCMSDGRTLVDYAAEMERSEYGHSRTEILDHLHMTWTLMRRAIDRGLEARGTLPGPLRVERRARDLWKRWHERSRTVTLSAESTRASIYAIAVAEENADGGAVVTAPTCGSAGVVPACLRMMQEGRGCSDEEVLEGLWVAGIIGGLAIAKASIAGALVGCQGEIGVASAMAAAAVCHLLGGSVMDQIDRAAETALEHFLGLTCDPVAGLVQIPCIERNAAGAASALNAANLAMLSGGRDRVSFDATLEVMHQTGLDLRGRYKETALGGLAAVPDLDRDGVPDVSEDAAAM